MTNVDTASETAFKPFLVEGGRDGKNVFRVVEMIGGVTREQVEQLLEQLPIGFQHRMGFSDLEDLREPLNVHVERTLVYIYPAERRVIACASLDSWSRAAVVSRMHVDNLLDLKSPGRGQLRCCVHLDPAILGITGWPGTDGNELEIDIHAFPKSKVDEPVLTPPRFGKRDVERLLELIAGGKRELTVDQFGEWHELIMYAVLCMRYSYENPRVPEDDTVRCYYRRHWQEIDEAEDPIALVRALESLRGSIQWE